MYIEFAKYTGDKNKGYTKNSASLTDGKEKYNKNQYFTEILLGGECPYCTVKGDHWYHENTAFEETRKIDEKTGKPEVIYFDYARIYLPYDKQVESNEDSNYINSFDQEAYIYVTAHETGHMMGLADGYVYKGYDRFTDNAETGVKCKIKKYNGAYDNLMKQKEWKTPLVLNDLEMMLYAYQLNEGKPWNNAQYYKKVKELDMEISPCISNDYDEYLDKTETK